jgi:hypothetical protein
MIFLQCSPKIETKAIYFFRNKKTWTCNSSIRPVVFLLSNNTLINEVLVHPSSIIKDRCTELNYKTLYMFLIGTKKAYWNRSFQKGKHIEIIKTNESPLNFFDFFLTFSISILFQLCPFESAQAGRLKLLAELLKVICLISFF